MTGAAVQWLRDGLQIVGSAAETAAIAATVDDSEGVVFVPALTGLGAPDWDPHARGLIIGITRGTTRAHLVRATLEAIAFEVRDVVDTLPSRTAADSASPSTAAPAPTTCSASSRPTSSASRSSGPKIVETTALGAAFLAGLGAGVWSSTDELRETWQLDRRFEPAGRPRATADAAHARWRDAVERVEGLGGLEPAERPSAACSSASCASAYLSSARSFCSSASTASSSSVSSSCSSSATRPRASSSSSAACRVRGLAPC